MNQTNQQESFMRSNVLKKSDHSVYHTASDNLKPLLKLHITDLSVDPVVVDDESAADLGDFEAKYLLGAQSFA
jgi:hypothetical protein